MNFNYDAYHTIFLHVFFVIVGKAIIQLIYYANIHIFVKAFSHF